MASLPRNIDIFGTSPYGVAGEVPPPQLPQVLTGSSVRPGVPGTRGVSWSGVPEENTLGGGSGVSWGGVPEENTSVPVKGGGTPTVAQKPTPTPPQTPTVFSQPDLYAFLQGFPHTPQGLKAAYAANPGVFGGAQIIGRDGDALRFPNGMIVDVIRAATPTGGEGWQWIDTTTPTAGMGFTDPTQQFLLAGADTRLAQLQQLMQSQPSLGQITQLVNQAVGQWAGPQVKPESFQAAIQALSRALGEKRPENAQLPQVTANLRTRIGQLRGDPYSAGDEAVIRAQAFDQLERDRTAAKARILEELGARGHAATSGIVARALQEVDRQFDTHRATNTNKMAMSEMALRESRGGAADQLELALANLGGIDQQAEMAWRAQQLQAGVNAATLDIGWQQEVNRRLSAAMQAAGTLTGLQTAQWAQQNELGNQAYQVSQAPYNMGLSSMAAANNVLSGQPTLASLLQALSGLSGQQMQQNQIGSQNTAAYLNALMGLIGAMYRG